MNVRTVVREPPALTTEVAGAPEIPESKQLATDAKIDAKVPGPRNLTADPETKQELRAFILEMNEQRINPRKNRLNVVLAGLIQREQQSSRNRKRAKKAMLLDEQMDKC